MARQVEFKEKLFGPVFEILDGKVRAFVASQSADGGKTYGAPKIEIRRVWEGTGQTGKREGLSFEVLSELRQKGIWENLMETLAEATDRWSVSRYNSANQGGVERRRRTEKPSVAANMAEMQSQVAALADTVAQIGQAVGLLLQQAEQGTKKKKTTTRKAKVAAPKEPEADPFEDDDDGAGE